MRSRPIEPSFVGWVKRRRRPVPTILRQMTAMGTGARETAVDDEQGATRLCRPYLLVADDRRRSSTSTTSAPSPRQRKISIASTG